MIVLSAMPWLVNAAPCVLVLSVVVQTPWLDGSPKVLPPSAHLGHVCDMVFDGLALVQIPFSYPCHGSQWFDEGPFNIVGVRDR